MIKYIIKVKLTTEPEIELPEGSLVASIEYHHGYKDNSDLIVPECWQVTWLEPQKA